MFFGNSGVVAEEAVVFHFVLKVVKKLYYRLVSYIPLEIEVEDKVEGFVLHIRKACGHRLTLDTEKVKSAIGETGKKAVKASGGMGKGKGKGYNGSVLGNLETIREKDKSRIIVLYIGDIFRYYLKSVHFRTHSRANSRTIGLFRLSNYLGTLCGSA